MSKNNFFYYSFSIDLTDHKDKSDYNLNSCYISWDNTTLLSTNNKNPFIEFNFTI